MDNDSPFLLQIINNCGLVVFIPRPYYPTPTLFPTSRAWHIIYIYIYNSNHIWQARPSLYNSRFSLNHIWRARPTFWIAKNLKSRSWLQLSLSSQNNKRRWLLGMERWCQYWNTNHAFFSFSRRPKPTKATPLRNLFQGL